MQGCEMNLSNPGLHLKSLYYERLKRLYFHICLQETLVDDHTCVLVLPPALGDKGKESLLAAPLPLS